MSAKLAKGNVDDRSVVPQMTADMHGFLFADKPRTFPPLARSGTEINYGNKMQYEKYFDDF